MKPPCKDCGRRAAECKKTCPEWEEYETEYLKEFEETTKQRIFKNDINSFKVDMANKSRRRSK